MSATTTEIHPDVARILDRGLGLLIGGAPSEGGNGETFETIDPSFERPLTTVARATVVDVDRAVGVARANFESGSWSRATPRFRERVLLRFAELAEQQTEIFAQLDSLDSGAPLRDTRKAAAGLVDHFRYFAGWATKLHGLTIPVSTEGQWLNYTKREPIGVVAAIIPWNTPIANAMWKLAAPLAAGCSVILKPAELTPLSAHRIAELLYESGLPEGTLSIVHGYGDIGRALAEHPDVDKVAFTGSTEVGREIVRASAGNLKRVSLELGGKSPAVVFDDADLEKAIPGVFNGIYFNAGQICVASSRVLLQAGIYETFLEKLSDYARGLRMGPGMSEASSLGPVVSRSQYERVSSYLSVGSSEGARSVLGGDDAIDDSEVGFFVKPTIFADVTPDMRIFREEIFGPVLAASRFESEDEVGPLANATIYGLGASVWTESIGRALRTVDQIRSGIVWVNGHGQVDPASPFGGFKQSGYGKELGFEVLQNYLGTKSAWINYGA
jgi:acyl-CoA reductase-like NAD-dependent aldehyde dehydrogenase